MATSVEQAEQQAMEIEKSQPADTTQQHETDEHLCKLKQRPTQHRGNSKCLGCGRTGHIHNSIDCPAKGKTCFHCKIENHFESMCFNKKKDSANTQRSQPPDKHVNPTMRKNLQTLQTNSDDDDDNHYLFAIEQKEKTDVILKVDGHSVGFLIDSGASVNIMDQTSFDNLQKTCKLTVYPTNTRIYSYGSKTPIPLKGVVYGNIEHEGTHHLGRFHITTACDSGCVLGRCKTFSDPLHKNL